MAQRLRGISDEEAMTLNTAKRNGPAWYDLRRLFNDAEIVEISLACRICNAGKSPGNECRVT